MKAIYLPILSILSFLTVGCAYWSHVKTTTYGLMEINTIDKLGTAKQGMYKNASPIIQLDNGVQLIFHIPSIYSQSPTERKDITFPNLQIDFYMISTKKNINLLTSKLKFIYTKFNIEKSILMSLDYFTRKVERNGIWQTYQIINPSSEKYYHKNLLPLPVRNFPITSQDDYWNLAADEKVVQGMMMIKDTDIAGENGFFKIVLSFIENGVEKKYNVYFHPIEYDVFIR